jgi:Aminoglycoside-2''-adenylyltransferase
MPLPEGVTHWDGPPLEAWKPWAPDECARVLAGYDKPWCVVGGWALDLSVGRETRFHEDLEIAIPRDDFPAIRAHLEGAGYILHEVGDGEVRRLDADTQRNPLKHQNWVLDPNADAWRVDVMLEPGDGETWVFRRDERIRAPRAAMIGARDGVPHLKAHGALLYKAKGQRPKDETDFAVAAPLIAREERAWLIEALSLVHAGHAWIAALTA